MRKLASTFLIVSLAAVAIFGFHLFDHSMMGGPDNDCVASTIDGTVCPTSLMDMTLHHVSVLQALTRTVVPSAGGLLLFMTSLILIFTSAVFLYKNLLDPGIEFLRLGDSKPKFSHSRKKIISWLALLELSPSLL